MIKRPPTIFLPEPPNFPDYTDAGNPPFEGAWHNFTLLLGGTRQIGACRADRKEGWVERAVEIDGKKVLNPLSTEDNDERPILTEIVYGKVEYVFTTDRNYGLPEPALANPDTLGDLFEPLNVPFHGAYYGMVVTLDGKPQRSVVYADRAEGLVNKMVPASPGSDEREWKQFRGKVEFIVPEDYYATMATAE